LFLFICAVAGGEHEMTLNKGGGLRKIRVEDCQFQVHEGVTVLTGPEGGLIVPSLRSYDEPLDVRTVAGLFRAQRERDSLDKDPVRYSTGHFGPIVNTELQCDNEACPCRRERLPQRIARSL
jgi:hypothetical protein